MTDRIFERPASTRSRAYAVHYNDGNRPLCRTDYRRALVTIPTLATDFETVTCKRCLFLMDLLP